MVASLVTCGIDHTWAGFGYSFYPQWIGLEMFSGTNGSANHLGVGLVEARYQGHQIEPDLICIFIGWGLKGHQIDTDLIVFIFGRGAPHVETPVWVDHPRVGDLADSMRLDRVAGGSHHPGVAGGSIARRCELRRGGALNLLRSVLVQKEHKKKVARTFIERKVCVCVCVCWFLLFPERKEVKYKRPVAERKEVQRPQDYPL